MTQHERGAKESDDGERQGAQLVKDIILTGVRWSLASPLSYRQAQELMQAQGVTVDHTTIRR